MSKIFDEVIKEIPNIGDIVEIINGDNITFQSGKNFNMDGNSVTKGDVIIRAYFEFNKDNKELYVWIELSSGASSYGNKWNSVIRHERRLKLERI